MSVWEMLSTPSREEWPERATHGQYTNTVNSMQQECEAFNTHALMCCIGSKA